MTCWRAGLLAWSRNGLPSRKACPLWRATKTAATAATVQARVSQRVSQRQVGRKANASPRSTASGSSTTTACTTRGWTGRPVISMAFTVGTTEPHTLRFMPTTFTDDLRLAHVLADDADSLSTSRFQALDLRVDTKPDLTPVT